MASTRRKSAAIALAVVGIAGLSLASAATLNITPDTLQAGTDDLTGCQGAAAVDVEFTSSWSGTAGEYVADGVVLDGIDAACATKVVEFTLLDGADAVLFSSVGAPAVDGTFTVTGAVPAEDVEAISVVIHS